MNDYATIISELGGASWSPYLAGGLLGVLTWLTFSYSDKPIGASSAYATLVGLIGKKIAPRHTEKLKYYEENPPKVNWELIFVLSAIAGSFIAALTGGEFQVRWVPELWSLKHPDTSYGIIAFIGGIFMSFGARLAGGCTSGHGISGTLQLSLASWVSLICFFIGGIMAIRFIY
jgi:uncharacterized protein